MKILTLKQLSILLALAAFFGCQSTAEQSGKPAEIREIPLETGTASGEPNLHLANDGRLFVSWIEPVEGGRFALRFSPLADSAWAPAKTAATGENWFVNWADFPSLCLLEDGTLAVHWLEKSSSATFAYGIRIAFSPDGGESWRPPVFPHDDGTATEHGFVSLLPWGGKSVLAAWLDGRNTVGNGQDGNGGAMTLRAAIIDADGTVRQPHEIDARVCDCCQTSAAKIPGGALIAYRDRSPEEIRDIACVRYVDGQWSAPKRLHADGWEIPGCPVNGPAVAAAGDRVAIAWFTGANDTSRINLSFSTDAGATFGPAIRIDDGDPIGRVDCELLPDGSAVVSWLAYAGEDAELRIKRVAANGEIGNSIAIAPMNSSRASGFPIMKRAGEQLYFAWTAIDGQPHVRTARLPWRGR